MAAPIIPENAPFTEEQRTWLNGFFAGWMAVENAGSMAPDAAKALLASQTNGSTAPSFAGTASRTASAGSSSTGAATATATATAVAEPPAGGGAEELTAEDLEGPWHDSSLNIDERMEMAKDKASAHKLMAAMAQLDCGACGYMCDTYALAIARREEPDLTLCSPGGRETERMLKKVVKDGLDAPAAEASAAPAPAASKPAAAKPAAAKPSAHTGRNTPVRTRVSAIRNLNGEGSAKHTVHVEVDLPDDRLKYKVGDSLGVYPHNDPGLVTQIQYALRAHGTEHVVAPHGIEAPLSDALRFTANLKDVSDDLIELVAASAKDADEKATVEALLEDDDALENADVLDVLKMAPSAIVDVKKFSQALRKLQPRLYSIASSPKAHPGQVHLTIAKVMYTVKDRVRLGVASSMFADRLKPGDTALSYVHAAPDFTVPEDASAPMIMVGPGTGVAPFRAFLEERAATESPGKNWLFFGDQHEKTDYLYGDEFAQMKKSGVLSRLSLAFSRDQDEKIYVQHRMLEEGAELYKWLEDGAYFFVCGDAKRMAGDVDKALHTLIAEHGVKSEDEAKQYIANLKKEKRYVRDVY
ncbi:MAG: sulfite reductase subunit alpha [Planctomycetota bacterium]